MKWVTLNLVITGSILINGRPHPLVEVEHDDSFIFAV